MVKYLSLHPIHQTRKKIPFKKIEGDVIKKMYYYAKAT